MVDVPHICMAGICEEIVSLIDHMINEFADGNYTKPGGEFSPPLLTFGNLKFQDSVSDITKKSMKRSLHSPNLDS